MKKIVIIDHEPLTIRRRQIFYIDELRAAGFDVEFWDCSQYFHPGIVLADMLNEPYLRRMEAYDQIKAAIDNQSSPNSLFIVECFNEWKNRRVFKLLAQKRCFTIRQEMYATAVLKAPVASIFKRLARVPASVIKHPIEFTKSQLYKLYKLYYGIKYSAMVSSSSDYYVNCHINHPDWESAQAIRQDVPLIDYPYALFLDEYFSKHPDMLFFNKSSKVANSEKYQQTMVDFFDQIEQRYNIGVVIAAHPKAEYADGYFGDRQIIKYQTAPLIKDSQMVFAHASAAVAYAAIFDKAIALVATSDHRSIKSTFSYMQLMATTLGVKVSNIEDPTSIEACSIPANNRNEYIYRFLTTRDIQDKTNAELLCQYYKSL